MHDGTRRSRHAPAPEPPEPDPLDTATLILSDEDAPLSDVLWALGVLEGAAA